MQQGNRRAILAALVANAGIAVAKFVGFLFTGASSMLAEAVHSVADSSNQGLLLWGGVAARRAPTAQHPFGFGRERYFWSFVVALVIFSLGALFAIYEGISKLLHPHALTSPGWALGILGVAIALETYSFRTAIVEARLEKQGASWWEFVRPLDLAKLSRGIDAVEARVRASQQHRCLIYIEPAVFDPDMAAAPPETSGTPGSSPSDTT